MLWRFCGLVPLRGHVAFPLIVLYEVRLQKGLDVLWFALMKRRPLVRMITIAGGGILLLLGGAALAGRIAGSRVLRPLVDIQLQRIAGLCDCAISYEELQFRLRSGLHLRGVRVSRGGPLPLEVTIAAAAVRSRLVNAVRFWRRRDALRLPSTPPPDEISELVRWLQPVLGSLDAAGLRLPVITVAGLTVQAGYAESELALQEANLRAARDAQAQTITILLEIPAFRADEGEASLSAGDLGVELTLCEADYSLALAIASDALILEASDGTGGQLQMDIGAVLDEYERVEVSGMVSVREGTLSIAALASDPVEPINFHYEFATEIDPHRRNHPPRFISQPADLLPFSRGSVTFSRGEALLNGIGFSVTPRLTGLIPPGRTDRGPRGGAHAGEGGAWNAAAPDASGEQSGLAAMLTSARRFLDLRLVLPATDADTIRSSLPEAILGPMTETRLQGRVGWELDLHVPLHAVSLMSWRSRVTTHEFGVTQIPWGTNVYKLNGPFVDVLGDESANDSRAVLLPSMRLPDTAWTQELSEFGPRSVARWREELSAQAARVAANPPQILGPDVAVLSREPDPRYRYVRLEEMSVWIPRAILTAEDGDFFYHQGVNFYTLPRALERNIRAGEIQFGASTLSMQLVKMLFLDAGRIVARKLQEVFLVYLMENVVPVPKERILELYLNLAEFGPGIYGIADASWYYFRKAPATLTAGEAVWLASILPSPRRYHQYYAAGAISPGWFERMKSYFAVMLERERMSEEEYADAILAPPAFAYASPQQQQN